MMRTKVILALFAVCCVAGNSVAGVVVTDHPQGSTADEFYNSLVASEGFATGNGLGGTQNRYSMDAGDGDTQTFTLAEAITLNSIFLGYNDQRSSGSFLLDIDVDNDGSIDYTYTITVPAVGDWQTGGDNAGPVHFLQFDVSSDRIALGAGQHSFTFAGVTDNGEGAFLIAPIFNTAGYSGGALTSNGHRTNNDNDDFIFAVISGDVRGQAINPSPTGKIDIDAVANQLSWDPTDDPNVIAVTKYDLVYYSKPTASVTDDDPNFVGITPVTDVTSPYPLSFDYETTYFWRIDSHVIWDSNEITDVVKGQVWEFNTLVSDRAPVVTIPEDSDSLVTWLANLPEIGLAGMVDDKGENDLTSVTWEIISGPGIAAPEAMQMINRTNPAGLGYLAELVSDPNLLRDWIGTDTRAGGSDVMTLMLSGLPAGTYNWTSYHHDADAVASAQSGQFDVILNDSTGSATISGIDISDSNEVVTTLALTIVSDGSDVILDFVKEPNANIDEAFFVMNGFELTGTGEPLKIDFTQNATAPDPVLVMTGYQGYLADHEDADSFTAQSFSAFGSIVTVTPSWDYVAATVTDITMDETASTQTASFDVTATPLATTGVYTVQLTAEDNAAQSDSDTLQIRVETDACAAAKQTPGFSINYYDSDKDCNVDIVDFAAFASEWLDDLSLVDTFIN